MPASTAILPYDAALAFLYGRLDYERNCDVQRRRWDLKLDRMRRLLERLGDPQQQFPIVHVAGTKGKGSTATMVAAVLSEAGYRTGLYTSPHLERLEQRMQVDGAACTPEQLVELIASVQGAVEAMDAEAGGDKDGQPTFFEITTAMALLHFRRRAVRAAVLEVGLGGRLDSTNVCQPCVSVITSISLDHTDQLGKTLASIAREKAGIVKPGVPVVVGVTQPEPLAEIEQAAARHGCRIRRLGREFDLEYHGPAAEEGANAESASLPVARATIRSAPADGRQEPFQMTQVRLEMRGRHQAANAAVATETLLELRRQGWNIGDDAVREGLETARCAARVELVQRRPNIVIDVAHNVASIEALVETLDEYFPRGPRRLLFAASRDKDIAGMLRLLLPRFDRVMLTRYLHNARGAEPQELLQLSRELRAELASAGVEPAFADGDDGFLSVHDDPRQALDAALASASPDELICVTGSFFLAAELRPLLLGTSPADTAVVAPLSAV